MAIAGSQSGRTRVAKFRRWERLAIEKDGMGEEQERPNEGQIIGTFF